MGYCSGPFGCQGQTVRKVLEDRADVVLVWPVWPCAWRVQLEELEALGAIVMADWQLRREPDMFMVGPRVPAKGRGPTGCKAPPAMLCAAPSSPGRKRNGWPPRLRASRPRASGFIFYRDQPCGRWRMRSLGARSRCSAAAFFFSLERQRMGSR